MTSGRSPVQRMAVALFPRKRTHRRRQQTHRRGNFIVVGGKVHLQVHAGAAARGGYRDGIAHQKIMPSSLWLDTLHRGVIRCPLAKAHPACPRPCCVHPAAHLHHGVPGCMGVPADVQVAERRHGKLRGGVAAVQKGCARPRCPAPVRRFPVQGCPAARGKRSLSPAAQDYSVVPWDIAPFRSFIAYFSGVSSSA